MPEQIESPYGMMRAIVTEATERDGEWAGGPLPVANIPMVIEPRYPYAGLNGMMIEDGKLKKRDKVEPEATDEKIEVLNTFYSDRLQAEVTIVSVNGRSIHYCKPHYGSAKVNYWIETIGASHAWTLEAEWAAIGKLQGLVKPHTFEHYMLTGSFLETSKRSGLIYMFRKLRPTIAIRATATGSRIISVLCLHPIGYYEGTWAGVMTPTDDVIAHLMMMRGDESKFWAKANHHPLWDANAGL